MTTPHASPSDEIVCRELVELVTPYLEGALPADERALVDQHLASCDGCEAYVQQMRLTIRAVGHVSEDAITSKTRDDVLAIFRSWRDHRARG
ncbi:MAG: zf-HC2 domain-containing protein [Chloroflexi bacterium]|nr:zf-HC2 domain-containing protein [Chloroflexota bacterium]MBV9601371.1 zf-HC2 domain-containing protein [Chloroflexota bacterium]